MVRETREFFDGPLALAGSISHGASVFSALAMGADFAYIGTRFIASKEMLVSSSAKDIIYSSTFTGVHGNYLKPSIEKAGLDPSNLPQADKNDMNFGSSGLSGDNTKKAWKDIWGSGQGIGTIADIPSVEECVDSLIEEYELALNSLQERTNLLGI